MKLFGQLSAASKTLVTVTGVASVGVAASVTYALAAPGGAPASPATPPGAAPQPTINSGPVSPTVSTSAAFAYSDSRPQVNFQCSVDTAAFTPCPATGIAYPGPFANGNHTFRVEAQSGNGPLSAPAVWSWSVGAGSFPIAGTATSPFRPGTPAQSVDVLITNPFSFDIKVTSITMSVDHTTIKNGVINTACDGPTNLTVTRQFSGAATVPAKSAKHLSELAAVTASQWPQLQMPDLATNQDGCKATTFNLSYTGSATTP